MNFGGTGPGLFFINDFVIGKNGAFYFVGDTLLKNLPLVNPVQTQHKGGYEAYVLSLAPGTFQPTFYSYLGGPLSDFASGVAVDNAGNIFVVGSTSSKNFPTTPGAPKRSVTGTTDGYVIKITP
jgi:Beta-propeller repeat